MCISSSGRISFGAAPDDVATIAIYFVLCNRAQSQVVVAQSQSPVSSLQSPVKLRRIESYAIFIYAGNFRALSLSLSLSNLP